MVVGAPSRLVAVAVVASANGTVAAAVTGGVSVVAIDNDGAVFGDDDVVAVFVMNDHFAVSIDNHGAMTHDRTVVMTMPMSAVVTASDVN